MAYIIALGLDAQSHGAQWKETYVCWKTFTSHLGQVSNGQRNTQKDKHEIFTIEITFNKLITNEDHTNET